MALDLQMAQHMLSSMLSPRRLDFDPTDPGWWSKHWYGGTGDPGGPGRSGKKRGPIVDYNQKVHTYWPTQYLQSSAKDELKAAGFRPFDANDLVKMARHGVLEIGPEAWRRAETQHLGATDWSPYYASTDHLHRKGIEGLSYDELMMRGLALRNALAEIENRWNAKRAKR